MLRLDDKDGGARRYRLRWASPATVIATLALLVALTGTGIAANAAHQTTCGGRYYHPAAACHWPQFDGRDIYRHSLTGRNIKSGSLTAAVLARSVRASLRGATGPQGPQGPQGPPGPAGPGLLINGATRSGLDLKTWSASVAIQAGDHDYTQVATTATKFPNGMITGGLSYVWVLGSWNFHLKGFGVYQGAPGSIVLNLHADSDIAQTIVLSGWALGLD
jgi:hypothetical protein